MAIICRTCGSEIPAGEEACPRCGTAVPTAVPSPVPRVEAAPASPAAGVGAPSTSATPTTLPGLPETPVSPDSPTIHGHILQDTVAPAPPTPGAAETASAVEEPEPPRELNPYEQEQVENWIRQAHIQFRRRNLPAARELAFQARSLAPHLPLVHEIVGMVLEADGDELGAYREYRLACEEEPAPPEAETRLAKLTLRLPPATLAHLQPQAGAADKPLPAVAEARLPPEVRATLATAAVAPPPRPRHASLPAFFSLLLPGLGQFRNGEYVKGGLMALVWLACVSYSWGFFYTGVHQLHQNPLGDPTLWIAVGILIIDYLASILDAGMAGTDRGG